MTTIRGSVEVNRLRSRLKAAFDRARGIDADPETQADYARYLCVLVSGFVETAVAELAIEHCRGRSAPTVLNYASIQLDRTQNLNAGKLLQLVNAFDPKWFADLSVYIEGARKDALNSVLNLRNKIAHGESVSLSMARITAYFKEIDEIIGYVEKLLK
jgi:HEPN superfamily RiboL-PSP-like protein